MVCGLICHNKVMAAIIDVVDFHKRFGAKKGVHAVQGVSFAIPSGQTVGFVGPNGAGKSTTIKALLGFIQASSGTLTLGGHPAGSNAARALVGFMPEHPAFPDTLTGGEWVRYAHRLHKGTKVSAVAINQIMEEVGLGQATDRLIRGYSKGMLQRLGLAQALIADPELLILDEPLSGLDPLGRAAFKAVLRRHVSMGRTLFFTSHILEDVEDLCERIILVHKGTIAIDQTTTDLLERATNTYFVEAAGDAGLSDRFPFRSVAGGVRLEVPAAERREVVEYLVGQGIDVLGIQPKRISLEQLFVDVVTAREGHTLTMEESA